MKYQRCVNKFEGLLDSLSNLPDKDQVSISIDSKKMSGTKVNDSEALQSGRDKKTY